MDPRLEAYHMEIGQNEGGKVSKYATIIKIYVYD